MLIPTLPLDYAVMLDPADRVRRTRSRTIGIRHSKPERPMNGDGVRP